MRVHSSSGGARVARRLGRRASGGHQLPQAARARDQHGLDPDALAETGYGTAVHFPLVLNLCFCLKRVNVRVAWNALTETRRTLPVHGTLW